MASRMRVTSLMDEARCYQALPITAKTIGHRTQDGTLDCRNEVSSSPDQNCAKREGERNCGNMERAKGSEPWSVFALIFSISSIIAHSRICVWRQLRTKANQSES